MWTPRRVALLLGGMLLFFAAYFGYARALGWLDGLPQIPHKFTIPNQGEFYVQKSAISPTTQRLIEAFGADCPELSDQNYPTKLEFRTGESSVVLAAGATPLVTGTNRMTLAPFSLASFGKPRSRQPGEVVEITTFHADKAILEFDRVINTPNDMNRAKLLRLELVSEPEQALPDPRRGVVHITNNQRSADANKFMVLRTVGPIFYRDRKNNGDLGSGPDIWTDAAVEIIDRSNLPRGYGAPAPATAQSRGADLREPSAVPAILAGQRLPPPTVTAIGMKIFLEPEPKQPVPKKDKEKAPAVGGIQRLELRERVLINLWTDAQQGFISTPMSTATPKPAVEKKPENPLAIPDPPAAMGGAVGGLFFATQAVRAKDRSLLQIETLGPFAYDMEKNLGRFDVLPQANPNLPNDVQVSRIQPRGNKQQLFTQVLEIEFNGSPTGPQPNASAKTESGGLGVPPGGTAKVEPDGTTFKLLHAWTYTPGRFLTISAEEERLEAYGQDLLFEQAANRTTLTGGPLYAVRSNAPQPDGSKAGGNVLSAGAQNRTAKLILEPGPGPERKTVVRVEGPGKFEIFDPASKGNTIQATWLTSMTQTKEIVNGREQDRFTFTDGAKFEDTQADYWLKGRELKLWLQEMKKDDSKAAPSQPLPQRLLATGNVTSHSGDIEIEQCEFLTVMFRDGQPPPAPKVSPMGPLLPPPMPTVQPMNPMPMANAVPPAEKPKDKPKPPLKLKGRVIDTWVVRYPLPKGVDPKAAPKPDDKKADANKAGESSLKYELEKARCEGQVVVHQDPEDPAQPRGTDILGETLLIDNSPQGSVLTVTGNEKEPGQVHHDDVSILGPKVVIDQLHNLTTVDGSGSLSMRSGSDFTGTELKEPQVINVFWRDGMSFSGSNKTAEFLGKVRASQGESWVLCHTLQVHFDREVYFNQMNKPARSVAVVVDPKLPAAKSGKPKDKDTAKVEKVYCYPAPDDEREELKGANTVTFNQVERDETGKIVKTQQLTAKELAVFAQAQDNGRGEFYQKVVALGPGTVRIWQVGQKDTVGPDSQPPTPMTPGKPPESEMKLTIVTFSDQMTTKDKAKVYQEATFRGNIQVINAPADAPSATIERHRLPPRSTVLTCANQLVVSTHKRDKLPTAQRMDATGNAFIRSDEYDGWGELITYDGQFVVLEASGPSLARIMSRYDNSENSGKRIVYDRLKNSYKVDGSYGGTFQSTPPKK